MKKIVGFFFIVVLLISVVSVSVTYSAEYVTKKTFGVTGEFIIYVPFDFEVPSGNCGRVETWENIPSYPSIYGADPAHWESKFQGEYVRRGLYKFKNSETVCDPRFSISGVIDDMNSVDTLEGREIEPEDMGILVKRGTMAKNVFGLPTDDTLYSYELIHNSFGMSMSIDVLANIWYIGGNRQIVGAIVVDNRGYLTHPAVGKRFNKLTTVIKDGDYVILIIKESY